MGTALITGASAGIGADLASLFAADKHNLVIVARRKDRLDQLADELKAKHGIDVLVIPADLADPASPRAIFEATQAAGVQVDFLVNNAGLGTNGKFWELDEAREMAQIQVNVNTLVHLTRLYLPAMIERKTGRVLNIASTAAFQGGPFMATYYATKAFVVTFTEGLAGELHETGVSVTAHCPGATHTEFAAIAGNDSSRLFQRPGVATSMDVATDAYRAMNQGKTLRVHGLMNQLGVFSARVTPRKVLAAVASKLNRPPGS
jgi:short-subunit dehydrogenase